MDTVCRARCKKTKGHLAYTKNGLYNLTNTTSKQRKGYSNAWDGVKQNKKGTNK